MDLENLDQAFTGQEVTVTDVVAALIVLAAGIGIAYLVGRIAEKRFGRPDHHGEQVAKIAARAIRIAIIIVAVVWSLNILGLELGWLTIVVVIFLIAAVFMARPIAENLAAGLLLTVRPSFGVGDEIEVDGLSGEIIEFTDRSTVLRLRDGRRVHMPNTDVVANTVTVYTTDQARRSSLELAITDSADIDLAESTILAALESQESINIDPAPTVQARSLDEGVGLVVKFWHDSRISSGNLAIDHAVRAIKPALEVAGIRLAPSLELVVEASTTA